MARPRSLSANSTRVGAQIGEKQARYSAVRKQYFNELDESLRSELPKTPPTMALYLIEHFLPPQFAEVNSSTVEAARSAVDELETAAARDAKLEVAVSRLLEGPSLVALLIWISLFLFAAVRSVRDLVDSGFAWKVSADVGEVMQESQRTETTHYETITGGGYNSYGYAQPITRWRTSTTKRFQKIFVKMANGKEQVLDFVDFELSCRPGHRLSLIWAGRDDHCSRLCAYHNHDLDTTNHIRKSVNLAIRSPIWKGTSNAWLAYVLYGAVVGMWLMGSFDDGVGFGDAVTFVIFSMINWAFITGVYDLLARFRASFRVKRVEASIIKEIARVERELAASH